MNGISNGTVGNEDEKENGDILQPSTSSMGMVDMPKWNMSTRQLYEDNLKSTSMAPNKGIFHHHLPRERVPSVTESTSSDDSCVYMYKGDNENKNGNELNKTADCSSPEMDYLEMDFDPCQSNGQESSDGSYICENVDLDKDENVNETIVDSNSEVCATTPINFDVKYSSTSSWVEDINHDNVEPVPSTSNYQAPKVNEQCANAAQNLALEMNSYGDVNECLSSNLGASVLAQMPLSKDVHTLSRIMPPPVAPAPFANCQMGYGHRPCCSIVTYLGDQVEPLDGAREISQRTILKKHIAEATGNSCCMSSIHQALCTLNVVAASVSEDEINKILADKQNDSNMSVVDYLYSVSRGGIAASEMISGIGKRFNGFITTRFFCTQPRRKLNLSSWLLYWLRKDVVPVLSLNFHLTEDDCDNSVNTSWHFQIVRAVGQKGIHLFSQVDCVSEDIILKLLNNPSEVLISRDEVMNHWTPESDLTELMSPPDHSWKSYNVLGQIVNVIREGITGKSEDEMKHVKIPSPHRTGILLLIRTDNPNQKELIEASDLPLFGDIS